MINAYLTPFITSVLLLQIELCFAVGMNLKVLKKAFNLGSFLWVSSLNQIPSLISFLL